MSGVNGWQLATLAAVAAAAEPGDAAGLACRAEYSLLDRAPEESVVPAAAVHGLGLLAWAPLGRGVLTGKYRHGTPADSRGASPHFTRYVGRHRTEHAARVVEAVATAADGLGTSPLAVACAWVRDRIGVSASVVVGARDRAQLLGSLAAEDIAAAGRDPLRARRCQPAWRTSDGRAPDRTSAELRVGPGVPDVFAEFCAAGLWPGLGQTLAAQLAEAGITRPERRDGGERWPALPRMTDRRANRLVTSFVGAGQLYDVVELLVPAGDPGPLGGPAGGRAGRRRRGRRCAPTRGGCWSLPDAAVAQADRLARAIDPDVRRDDPRRGRALVDWTLARFARDGHTAAPDRCRRRRRPRPFGVDADAGRSAPRSTAGGVVRVADPAGSGDPWVARHALAAAESAIADGLARLVRSAKPLAGEERCSGAVTDLDAVQAGAVSLAAAHGVSLLTGGPGTGKSRTVAAIVALCRKVDATIALAAPTGRAAKRLEELAGNNATTVHRLLGARPRGRGSDRSRAGRSGLDLRPRRRQPDRGRRGGGRRGLDAGRRARRRADRRPGRRHPPGDRRRPGAAAVHRAGPGARRPHRQRRRFR